jgi:hypothetical protein
MYRERSALIKPVTWQAILSSHTLNNFMKAILVFFVLLVSSSEAFSQCDKKVTWYGAKGEMFDANGTLLDTKEDSIFFETDPEKITLRFKSDQKELEGTVKEKICDWKEPFKNGKTVYHTTVSMDGTTSNAIFTVEAKDQKITLSLEIEAMQGRKFLIYLDRYKEAK